MIVEGNAMANIMILLRMLRYNVTTSIVKCKFITFYVTYQCLLIYVQSSSDSEEISIQVEAPFLTITSAVCGKVGTTEKKLQVFYFKTQQFICSKYD